MLAAVAFDLEGKLTGKEVQETIDQHRDKFTPCLSSDATVTVRAKVQPSGTLSDVSVTNSVPNEPKLRDCVASVLRGLTFPKPKGGAAVSLTLDLTLSRKLSF